MSAKAGEKKKLKKTKIKKVLAKLNKFKIKFIVTPLNRMITCGKFEIIQKIALKILYSLNKCLIINQRILKKGIIYIKYYLINLFLNH